MGRIKHMMAEHENKRQFALEITIEAGVLETCEFHEDVVFEGRNDIEEAYRLGNKKYTDNKLSGVFASRREMTDFIKSVVEEHLAEECYCCAKIRRE